MNNNNGLRVAYLLLTTDRPLSTCELVSKTGCDRKTIYKCIDRLEDAGFCTSVINNKSGNMYSASLRC